MFCHQQRAVFDPTSSPSISDSLPPSKRIRLEWKPETTATSGLEAGSPGENVALRNLITAPAYDLRLMSVVDTLSSARSSLISADTATDLPSSQTSTSTRVSSDLQPKEDDQYSSKSTLINLLNNDTVRNDPRMRLSVQARLMEAEAELRRQRRRRTSVPVTTKACDDFVEEVRRASL